METGNNLFFSVHDGELLTGTRWESGRGRLPRLEQWNILPMWRDAARAKYDTTTLVLVSSHEWMHEWEIERYWTRVATNWQVSKKQAAKRIEVNVRVCVCIRWEPMEAFR